MMRLVVNDFINKIIRLKIIILDIDLVLSIGCSFNYLMLNFNNILFKKKFSEFVSIINIVLFYFVGLMFFLFKGI